MKIITQNVNFNLIRESANRLVKHAIENPESKQTDKYHKIFLSEGKKAPGYADIVLHEAKSIATKGNKDLESRYVFGLCDLITKNSKLVDEYIAKSCEMYPNTYFARKKILSKR